MGVFEVPKRKKRESSWAYLHFSQHFWNACWVCGPHALQDLMLCSPSILAIAPVLLRARISAAHQCVSNLRQHGLTWSSSLSVWYLHSPPADRLPKHFPSVLPTPNTNINSCSLIPAPGRNELCRPHWMVSYLLVRVVAVLSLSTNAHTCLCEKDIK